MSGTQTSPTVWLVGKPQKDITCSNLPTNLLVLKKLLYHHTEEKRTVKDSAKLAIKATLNFWEKARIPTQRIDSAERKLLKLYDEYCLLKKARLRVSENQKLKERV